MQEPLGPRLRPTGMRTAVVATMLCVPLLLSACGNEPTGGGSVGESPSTSACRSAGSTPLVKADLDGDGTLDEVTYESPSGTCPGMLWSSVKGLRGTPTIDWDVLGSAGSAAAVRLPGRHGDLVVLRETHPRGGFQAHLYGYADGRLAELTVDGQPVFPFVATDVLTDPISARCIQGGFEILHGRRHQPIGIVPAWDVFRTTYEVDGNVVRPGPTTKVADNVLEKDFATTYADLVHYSLFKDCLVAG